MGGTRGYTASTEDKLTSTAPVLPALSDYSVRPRHTRPTGPCTHCPATPSWFAFHTAVSVHVPSHFGTSRPVFVHAGLTPCAPRAHLAVMVTPRTHCHFTMQARALSFLNYVTTTALHHAWLPTHLRSRGIGLWTHWCFLTHYSHREGPVTFPACALH